MAADEPSLLRVEVVYATRERQSLLDVALPAPLTAREAVEHSGILALHPEIDLATAALGIYGEVVPGERQLRNGDRVEIYRALLIDPREARRALARRRRSLADPD